MLTIFHIFFSAHNTMYLEVHCPAVRPHVVVVSDCGRTVVDFENVSLGKIYSRHQTRELFDFIVIKLVCVRSICYPPIMRKFKANCFSVLIVCSMLLLCIVIELFDYKRSFG